MRSSNTSRILSSAFIILVSSLFISAAADDILDLNEKTFMVFIPIDTNGNPNPDGEALSPAIIRFAQRGNALWGCLVGIDETALVTKLQLKPDTSMLTDGEVKNAKKFTMHLVDTLSGYPVDAKFKAKLQKDGSFKAKASLLGMKFVLKFYPVNTDGELVSGVYYGNVNKPGFYKTKDANILGGFMVLDKEIRILFFYMTAQGQLYMSVLQGTFDPKSGNFTAAGFSPEGAMNMNGTIEDGEVEYFTTMLGQNVNGKAYAYGDEKQVKPKYKRLRDKNGKVLIRGKQFIYGLLVAVEQTPTSPSGVTADVYVKQYELVGKKIKLIYKTSPNFSGQFRFKLINPSGEYVYTDPITIK